jgi:hypothetical protein
MITLLKRQREVPYGRNKAFITQYASDDPENAANASGPGFPTARELHMLFGVNGGPDQWIHIFDSATAPAGGSKPRIKIKAAAGLNFGLGMGNFQNWMFENGIYICNSTTKDTLTLGAANCDFYIQVS